MSRIRGANALVVATFLVVTAGVLFAACGGASPSPSTATAAPPAATQAPASAPAPESPVAGEPSPAGGEPSPAAGGAEVAVSIAGFAFSPAAVTVTVGGTVTWTHADGAPHTVVADDGAFESARLGQGDTFSNTFLQAGSVPYHCSIHPSMTGTVTVMP